MRHALQLTQNIRFGGDKDLLHLWFKKEEGKEGRKEGRKEGKERRKGGRKEGRKEGKEGAGGVQAMPEADRLRHLNIMLFSEMRRLRSSVRDGRE